MYTIYNIDDEKSQSTAITFRFNGKKLIADNGMKEVEVSREELESLIDWLRMNSEKMNRDYWDRQQSKTSDPVFCDCVRPA